MFDRSVRASESGPAHQLRHSDRTMPIGPELVETTAPRVAQDRGPGAPLPPTLIFAAGIGAGWWLNLQWPLVPAGNAARLAWMAGAVLVGLGSGLFMWGLLTFARARTGILLQKPARQVVEAGPYTWSRNPQYVAFTAIYIGVALLLGTGWPLVLLPLVLGGLVSAVISREERYMRSVFGAGYEDYCRRVPRWL